jgi:hypothetical protein
MEKSIRIIIAAAVIALGIWLWTVLFPSPEKVIRSRLNDLAETISFKGGEGTISKVYHAQKVPDFFTTNVIITAEVPGYGTQTMEGRENLAQAALLSRQKLQSLKVEFVGINITLAPDKQSATANLTAKITTSQSSDFNPQELNFMLRKEDGKWLIYRVETVNTLTKLNRRDELHESPAF